MCLRSIVNSDHAQLCNIGEGAGAHGAWLSHLLMRRSHSPIHVHSMKLHIYCHFENHLDIIHIVMFINTLHIRLKILHCGFIEHR